MKSVEVYEGMRVRVNASRWHRLNGQVGTVMQTYGYPAHRAVEVFFDFGESELFWFYQLDRIADEYAEANRQASEGR